MTSKNEFNINLDSLRSDFSFISSCNNLIIALLKKKVFFADLVKTWLASDSFISFQNKVLSKNNFSHQQFWSEAFNEDGHKKIFLKLFDTICNSSELPCHEVKNFSNVEIKAEEDPDNGLGGIKIQVHYFDDLSKRKFIASASSAVVRLMCGLTALALAAYGVAILVMYMKYGSLTLSAGLLGGGLLALGLQAIFYMAYHCACKYQRADRYNVNLPAGSWQYNLLALLWVCASSSVLVGLIMGKLSGLPVLADLGLGFQWTVYAIVVGLPLVLIYRGLTAAAETMGRAEYLSDKFKKVFSLGVLRFIGVCVGLGVLCLGMCGLIVQAQGLLIYMAAVIGPLATVGVIVWERYHSIVKSPGKTFLLKGLELFSLVGLLFTFAFCIFGLLAEFLVPSVQLLPIVLGGGMLFLFSLVFLGTYFGFKTAKPGFKPCVFAYMFFSLMPACNHTQKSLYIPSKFFFHFNHAFTIASPKDPCYQECGFDEKPKAKVHAAYRS